MILCDIGVLQRLKCNQYSSDNYFCVFPFFSFSFVKSKRDIPKIKDDMLVEPSSSSRAFSKETFPYSKSLYLDKENLPFSHYLY